MQTIIIGHKNPDMDSICSAIAYAHLKQTLGWPEVTAGRAGAINERIRYVLERFRIEPPPFYADVAPRVVDVMEQKVISVQGESAVYDAIQLVVGGRLRGLPVVDAAGCCLGLLSMHGITGYLFPPREQSANTRMVSASIETMVETFGGELLVAGNPKQVRRWRLVVAAMAATLFFDRLNRYEPGTIALIVGDRDSIQCQALEQGVQLLIVTGGVAVDVAVLSLARRTGATVVSSPHDTATTVLLARGAARADHMIDREFVSLTPETTLERAREVVSESKQFVFPILNESKELVGILAKSDFLKPIPRQLILVDHNELSQAVHGAELLPIIEVLDHHRLGGFSTTTPVLFWNNPVGSTSTIVALCYRQSGIPIPPPIAGLLMAGLISDTLNLTSPTATAVDREVMQELSRITGVDPGVLAAEVFSVGSPLLTMTPEQAVAADSKEYEEKGVRFTVSQIEELTFLHLEDKADALSAALEAHCAAANLYFAALLVTDINVQNSILFVAGNADFCHRIDYPQAGHNRWELDGVVSRKKQLLPYLLQALAS